MYFTLIGCTSLEHVFLFVQHVSLVFFDTCIYVYLFTFVLPFVLPLLPFHMITTLVFFFFFLKNVFALLTFTSLHNLTFFRAVQDMT